MKTILIIITAMILLSLYACHKEGTNAIGSGSVIVINEGGYGHGNADISIYNPTSKTVSNNIFSQENYPLTLGDVAQDLCLIGDTAYIVMNHSQRVVLARVSQNFKYITSISLPNASPRFFLPVDGRRAYVTELYANKIWVVDYKADTLIKSIAVSGWTEQLISWNGKIYVQEQTTPGGTSVHAVLMIDPTTDQIVSTLPLSSDPGSMALTAQNKLFVLCPQQTNPTIPASLYNIDLASFAIQKQINFSSTRTPNYIRYSSLSNQLLFSDSGGVYSMSPTDTVVPSGTFIQSDNWNVYGLNADPVSGDIYISDAVDYQQASHIWRYSQNGTLEDNFTAGIISNGFVFK
jgi:hypothetical protein